MEARMTMAMRKAAVNWGKCWDAQNQHVLVHSNLSKKWSCTYLLDNVKRVCTTNSNEAGLRNSHPLPFQKTAVPMLSRDRVSEPFQSNLSEGWALHKPKGGTVRFSEKERQYLISKFDIA